MALALPMVSGPALGQFDPASRSSCDDEIAKLRAALINNNLAYDDQHTDFLKQENGRFQERLDERITSEQANFQRNLKAIAERRNALQGNHFEKFLEARAVDREQAAEQKRSRQTLEEIRIEERSSFQERVAGSEFERDRNKRLHAKVTKDSIASVRKKCLATGAFSFPWDWFRG